MRHVLSSCGHHFPSRCSQSCFLHCCPQQLSSQHLCCGSQPCYGYKLIGLIFLSLRLLRNQRTLEGNKSFIYYNIYCGFSRISTYKMYIVMFLYIWHANYLSILKNLYVLLVPFCFYSYNNLWWRVGFEYNQICLLNKSLTKYS